MLIILTIIFLSFLYGSFNVKNGISTLDGGFNVMKINVRIIV